MKAMRIFRTGFALCGMMLAGLAAKADTIAWWHFDECEPGTTAPANTVASDQAPTTYAHVYTIGNNNTISALSENGGDYLPTYTKPFRGIAVYDPVTDTTRTNNAAMKFRIARGGSSPDSNAGRARFGGGLKFEGGYDLYESLYGTSAITVEAFLCTTGGAYNLFAPIVGSVNGTSWTDERFALYMRDDGTIAVRFATSDGSSVWYTGDGLGKTKVNDGAWHHVAFTYDGSHVRIYVDYALDKKSSDSSGRVYTKTGTIPTYSSDNVTWVGGYATGDANNGGRKFPGVIDEMRVSNATLQPEQFLRMQPLDMDSDEIVRVSFTPDEYGVLLKKDYMNLADALGPNRQKAVFRKVSDAGSSSYDTETKAGDIMAGKTETDTWVENAASFYQETNGVGKANYIQMNGISTVITNDAGANASYTVEMFFKTRKTIGGEGSGKQSIMRFGGQPWWDVRLDGENSKLHYVDNKADGTSDPFNRAESTADADDCKWHHVAVVVNGPAQKISFYFDYALDKSRTGTLPNVGNGNSIFFASRESGNGQFFDGWIDDIRVTHRALEPREFLTTRPVGSGDISLLALFEQNYDFICASNANLSVTGDDEARTGDNVPTFVKASRGTLLLDGTNGTEQATNDYSVHLSRGRVVFPSNPIWVLDSYTVEFWAKFDGVIDKNGTVASDPETLDSHIPIMRLATGNSNSYDWYVYRGREKSRNNCIQMAIGNEYPVWSLPSGKLLIDGKWHHYAFTFEPVNDGTNTLVQIFYDYKNVRYGNPSRSGVTVGSRLPKRVDGRLMLGEGSSPHPNLIGEFDAVRVSKGVLDPSQFLGRVRIGAVITIR